MIKAQILTQGMEGSQPAGNVHKENILPGEIQGLRIEHISVKGPCVPEENPKDGYYHVYLMLKGNGTIHSRGGKTHFKGRSVARIPFNEDYRIEIKKGEEFSCLLFRKQMEEQDLRIISQNAGDHSSLYVRSLSDCPAYTEDIKSARTINRMILPEGMVPRFCMGSVETSGPDVVAEHEHQMLDQLFLGLENCRCTCHADGEEMLLTENMILHIPLGSKHSVTVKEGDLLSYIWMDFFFTLEGQKYMEEQHRMEGKEI